MKKLLIIAYYFPPNKTVGSRRPAGLAKYFPQFGWEPIVLTEFSRFEGRRPSGIKLVESKFQDTILNRVKKKYLANNLSMENSQPIKSKQNTVSRFRRKATKLLRDIINYPDDHKLWFKHAIHTASELLAFEKVDAIISTSYPVTSHLIARTLKKEFGIPWIADLRDLWTQNPYIIKNPLISFIEEKLERRTLLDANVIVTVSKPWIRTLKELHTNKEIYCVTNGYDEDDYSARPKQLTNKFTITHAGQLYNGKRDPSVLFEVISHLIKQKKIDSSLIEIRFYGAVDEWLMNAIRKYEVEGIVKLFGPVSREEVLEKQRESQLLLLLLWNDKKEEGFCPGKLYEYFGLRRPIVAIGWPGSVTKEMIELTNSGKFAIDRASLQSIIQDYYNEYMLSGNVNCLSNNFIEQYTSRNITRQYTNILNKITS